jgi:hypothetical protein
MLFNNKDVKIFIVSERLNKLLLLNTYYAIMSEVSKQEKLKGKSTINDQQSTTSTGRTNVLIKNQLL